MSAHRLIVRDENCPSARYLVALVAPKHPRRLRDFIARVRCPHEPPHELTETPSIL
jgi:hypothetical protein